MGDKAASTDKSVKKVTKPDHTGQADKDNRQPKSANDAGARKTSDR